jgi:hypothetical protein
MEGKVMTNPIEQVIAYLKNDGLETDVNYWVGFQEEKNKSVIYPFGFDANIFANDKKDCMNGITISIYPLVMDGESFSSSESKSFTYVEVQVMFSVFKPNYGQRAIDEMMKVVHDIDPMVTDAIKNGTGFMVGGKYVSAEDVFVPVEEYKNVKPTKEGIGTISRKSKASVDLSVFSNEQLIDELLARCKTKKPPSPYHRKITKRALLNGLYMDSYDIDAMWPLPGNLSPLQHARKKALAPGSRGEGHKSIHKDLKEIAWSTAEAVETFKE